MMLHDESVQDFTIFHPIHSTLQVAVGHWQPSGVARHWHGADGGGSGHHVW